jgi:flagellar FliL protein
MARLFGNKKLLAALVVVVVLVGFFIYILVPSSLPKPIYIEFVSAESESAASATADHSDPTESHLSEPAEEVGETAPSEEPTPMVYPRVGQGIMYEVGSRIVNLLDPVGRRYLKINIVLEFLPPDYGYYQLDGEAREAERQKLVEEIAERKPIIDDLLISLLTSRSYEDIHTLEGKTQLRSDIQERLNQALQEPRIVAVYFTEFLVQ